MTEYERWSLTRLSKLSGDVDLNLYTAQTVLDSGIDRKVEPTGSRSVYFRTSTAKLGKGVGQAIRSVVPLIFTSSYKCLDLFVEWFLEINGENHTGNRWTFGEKISKIGSISLDKIPYSPAIFQKYPSIFNCLVNIYSELIDYRHSIIHKNNFELSNSSLIIYDKSDNSYTFRSDELFSFSGSILISIDAIVRGTFDFVTERQLKSMLDNLSFIHNTPNFDVTNHEAPLIRCPLEPLGTNPYEWDVPTDEIQKVSLVREGNDFWMNFVGLHNDDAVSEWLVPGDELVEYLDSELILPVEHFQEYRV